MTTLHFSENLLRLRREKGLTQEELAHFIGVTKASVSKWETRQNLPDILLLPQLASFFDVTVDELLGYEPQLSKEQIRLQYHALAKDFACLPFHEVMEHSQSLVKKYYSCYPFLLQICVLWLNHFMLAPKAEQQKDVLRSALALCRRIQENCHDTRLWGDAVTMSAMILLQLGNPQEAADTLEDSSDPLSFTKGCGPVLTQAYLLLGKADQADSFNQVSLYGHLLSLMQCGIQHLQLHQANWEVCQETLSRLDALAGAFDLPRLHPNITAIYHYQAALVCCANKKEALALDRLTQYAGLARALLREGAMLHGDDFFCRLDEWLEQLDLGVQGVRSSPLVLESFLQSLEHPAFDPLRDREEFRKIKHALDANAVRNI